MVHGFVGDQLLEQRVRRGPVDGAQVEEAGVEPRQQQLAQVVVEALEIGVVAAQRQQVGAQVDQELHPLRQRVELGEETQAGRSEEHTSELQSLMRISYAVFCLKQKSRTKQEKENKRRHNNNEI